MGKQIVLVLLLSLAVSAQQMQKIAVPSESPLVFFSENPFPDDISAKASAVAEASVAKDTTAAGGMPNALEPGAGLAPAAAVYQPRAHKPPEPAAVRDQKVFNKKFIAAHVALLGSIVYDSELTHQGLAHHECVEANSYLGLHPSRGELYRQNLLAFGAVGGLDWVAAKFIKIPYLPYVTPGVESVIHLRGGSKWLTQCW
ncbi:MAG TPA: hypothetical protein VMI06_15825 [Terriglobia bacterium]|nr:hypothetical protein [Terriglobia bacterium]